MDQQPRTAKSRYQSLQADRAQYLDRAREAARFTIPSLYPPEGTNGGSLPTPYNSIGSRAVNALASRLLMALMPPNEPIFRLRADEAALREEAAEQAAAAGAALGEAEFAQMMSSIEEGLSKVERSVMKEIEVSGDRSRMFNAFRCMIVGGDHVIWRLADETRTYSLSSFVLRRAGDAVIEIVTHERTHFDDLPEEFREDLPSATRKENVGREVDLYTWARIEDGRWVWHQEAFDKEIPGSEGDSPREGGAWIVVPWSLLGGEDYSRSYVEEYLGDIRSAEILTKAITEGAAAAAKVLFLVDPTGKTTVEDISDTDNLDIRAGNAADVTVLHMDKSHDFSVAQQLLQRIEQRISYAFLEHTAIQRDAERVTAEEVRYMAQQLEETLGGIYSMMSSRFQMPYVQRVMRLMEREGKIAPLPDGVVEPTIVTGLEALGRGNDRNKLILFLRTLQETIGPEMMGRFLNVSEAIKRLATADGIDTEGLMKSAEEVAQEQQQAQMMALVHQLGPQAIQQLGGAAQTQMKGMMDASQQGQAQQ